MTPTDALEKAIEFLRGIGLPVTPIPDEITGTFVAGVRVEAGGLQVGTNAIASSVLHEAGHLAIFPPSARRLASGRLTEAFRRVYEILETAEQDGPAYRAAIQCSDTEATAWAFAAGRAAGIPDDLIILDHEYDGEGEGIRTGLQCSAYFGINGLKHAGMTNLRGDMRYPQMLAWLQQHDTEGV